MDVNKQLAIIVAVAKNGVIGKDNTLPWRLGSDLQWFKHCTLGNAVIMGRQTFKSIGKPLPGRQNIVLSRKARSGRAGDDIQYCSTLSEAITVARSDKVFVIGGAQVYRIAVSRAQWLYLTVVDAEIDGDTWLPFIDLEDWTLKSCKPQTQDDNNQFACQFRIYRRNSA